MFQGELEQVIWTHPACRPAPSSARPTPDVGLPFRARTGVLTALATLLMTDVMMPEVTTWAPPFVLPPPPIQGIGNAGGFQMHRLGRGTTVFRAMAVTSFPAGFVDGFPGPCGGMGAGIRGPRR